MAQDRKEFRTNMDLALLYQEIDLRVKAVDFSALWSGFYPFHFALYDGERCFLNGRYMEKPDAFCANTALQWNGEFIAVWNAAEAPHDLDMLAAAIIHEMFHAFQMVSKERRFPNEQEALLRYRYSAGNLSAKRAEAYLLKAIVETDGSDAYARLLSLRKKRAEDHPYEYAYEAKIEQIEGTAKFVELSVLTQLDVGKGCSAWQSLLSRILQPERYFPIRPISYEIGAAVIACLRRCSHMDYERFTETPFSCEMLADADGVAGAVDDAEMAACLSRYLDETHRMIERAIAKNDRVLSGRYPLVSVNLWDARHEGRYLISNQFLCYSDGGADRVIYGDFVVEVDADCNVRSVLRQ